MAAATASTWIKGFSENPDGTALDAASLLELLARIGDEYVRPPGEAADEGARRLSRRELLARVVWTRALVDADTAAIKLLLECLEGRTGEAARPTLSADDLALAEALLREDLGHE